jgi:hypothetical protein
MAEGGETRVPFTITPAGEVWAPDTLRGKFNLAVGRVRKTYGRYFKGEDPLVKTKSDVETEAKK